MYVVTQVGVPVDLGADRRAPEAKPSVRVCALLLNQLKPLVHRPVERLYDRFVEFRLAQGSRLADIKLVALIPEATWIE